MTASLELLLVVGVVGFYLHDAMLLLHFDELALVRAGRRWLARAGGSQWGGRFWFMPNPLMPAQPVFRGSWLTPAADKPPASPDLPRFLLELRPFRVLATALWMQQLLVLPLLLWTYPHPLAVLALFALVYATVAALALLLWLRRARLELDRRAATALVVDCLLCPPHAINIVRRISLQWPLPQGVLAFAASVLDPDARRQLRQVIDGRLQWAGAGDDGPDPRLQDVHRQLAQVLP